MRTNRKTLAAGVGAAALLGLGLYLAVPAAAADPSPTPSTPGLTTHPGKGPEAKGHRGKGHPGKRHPHRHARPFRGVHGEATVRRKDGFHLATWQRGKITTVSSTALTARSADGTSWTWAVNADARVRKNGEKSALTALKTGDQVLVAGERSGTTRTARLVRVPKPR